MKYEFLKQRGALGEGRTAELTDDDVASVLAQTSDERTIRPAGKHTSRAQVTNKKFPDDVLALVPESVARENCVLPMSFDGERIFIAAVDADDVALADKLRFTLAKDVRLVAVDKASLERAIERNYGNRAESVDSLLMEFTDTAVDFDQDRLLTSRDMGEILKRRIQAREARSASRQRRTQQTAGVSEYRGFKQSSQRGPGMFYYTIEEGQRVLMTRLAGTKELIVGPRRVWIGFNRFQPLTQFIAHPGEFLTILNRDGSQEHRTGPCEVWLDPRVHERVSKEECLQIDSKEAVVVYSRSEEQGETPTTRRVVYGPALFTPQPGEWLHTFSWHASHGGHVGVEKQPNALVFQKLWLMPDQMYHDVRDVRTADNAVLTIRLMVFFELVDINRMLDATHDPIGDFVNATTADVVEFTGRYDFEQFKRTTEKLNDLETYRTLRSRAEQIGYQINNVVYRGYGAAESLQKMHDQAIEARTRLQLDRATEEQQQDLENFKLESQMGRAAKRRDEQTHEVQHQLELNRRKQESELRDQAQRQEFFRNERQAEAAQRLEIRKHEDEATREHLASLSLLGVDMTAYLTQSRADRVIELRGGAQPTHVHLDALLSESTSSNGTPERAGESQ